MRALRVLVAEEKDFMATRLATQLASLGHRVVGVVKDGDAAAVSAAHTEPDLILFDLHLPSAGGIEAARAIFSSHPIPSVLLTGYVGADLVRRGQEAGVFAYLVWPGDANALASAMRVALTRFRQFQVLAEQTGDAQQALRASLVVERAKRLLMRRLHLTEDEAFLYIRRQSWIIGLSARELATCILTAAEILFGRTDAVRCLTTILDVFGRRDALASPAGRLIRPA